MTENVIPRIPQLDYDPDWGELFGAAFRRENFVGSAIQKAKNSSLFGEDDPTPVSDTDINLAVDQAKLAPFIEHFTQVSTRGELNRKIAHIRQQAEDKAILDKGGWSGFGASLVAGVLDVPTLVPFGHAVRLGRLGTESMKTTASKLAMMAAIDASATEAGLQLTQDLRETEESALAVGGSVVLTTLLGTGVARYLSRRHFDDLSKRVEIELPKIADGRAEIEMADQVAQASANTARAISGDRLEMQTPAREFAPGDAVAKFLVDDGIEPRDFLDAIPDGSSRSVIIGADGKLYDLTGRYATHLDWTGKIDAAKNDVLSADTANVLQLSVYRNGDEYSIATGSQSPLTRKQLAGIRAAAKSYGIDQRNLYVRESRNGDVEVISRKEPPRSGTRLEDYKEPTGPEDLPTAQSVRNSKWYHGSGSDQITGDNLSSSFSDIEGLIGSGVYTSDRRSITESYAKSRGKGINKTPTVYEVDPGNIRDVVNADQPIQPRAVEALRRGVNDEMPELVGAIDQAAAKEGATFKTVMRELAEAVRDHAEDNGYPKSEYSSMYQSIESALREAGYDAITHIGGLHAGKGKKTHRVLILLDPQGEYAGIKMHGERTYGPLGAQVARAADEAPTPAPDDFKSLSRYESAENRARAAEKAGAPPQDPELRQGVPTTRWDGEAASDVRRSSGVMHKDSPVHLTREQFTAAVRRGMVGPAEPHNAAAYRALAGTDFARVDRGMGGVNGMLSVRGGRNEPEDWVTHIYNGLAAGYRTEDIARHQAHLYALSTDAQYREDVSAFFGGQRSERPEITDAQISAAYDLMQAAYRKEVGSGTGQITGQVGGVDAGGNAGGTGGGGGNNGGRGSGQLPPGGPPPKFIESDFAPQLTPSQMAFAESGGAIGATRGLSRMFGKSPILELMNSTSTAARAWIMTVAELPARTKAAYEGRVNPIAVQSRMAEYEGMRAVMTREFNDAYKGWRQGLDVMGRDYENFSRNVSQALVRWNLDEVDPNVARAAKSIRDTIAKMYERAVEQGLIRKDAWKPGESKNPFVDYNDIRRRAEDASWSDPNAVDIYRGGFDPKDAVDDFLSELAKHEPGKPGKKSKGAVNKITNLNANMDRLSATDAELYRQISRDVSSGGAALTDNAPAQFVREAGSRLVRGGQTGERGLDYNVGLRFDFGPNGELGDNLIQTGGLINRRYTDRLAHEHDAFLRAETLAELQDRDAVVRNARKWNEEQIAKAREEAKAKGEDPDKAAEDVVLDPNGTKGKMWHELSTSQKKMRLMSAMNHAKGAWEFIVHGTIRGGDSRVLNLEGAGRRSPLHRRNVKLSDEVLLAKGWIDDDALGIANHTVRQIASDVELARVFRRPMDAEEVRNAALGKPDAWWVDGKDPTTVPDIGMDVPRAVIGKEFDDAMAKLGSGPENDAARNAIRNERAMVLGGSDANGKQMQGLLDTVVEMVRGTHKVSENSTYAANNLDAARSYMFATRMGANVITSIGDLGAVTLNSGAPSLFKNFAVRARDLVSSLASPEAVANLATRWELPQDRVGAILAREARAAGIAVETDLMSRMASQMDLMDPFLNAKRKDTSFQQIASWLAKTGSKVYFINAWTNMVRRASYGIYVDRVVRAAMDPTQIAKHERVWLNDLGIDDKMLAGIRREVTENGGAEFDGGVWHLNHERWGDERLRSDFWAAGRKDANNSNVNPSQLEKPLAFTNPIVNTLLQFWSFSFGATMRIMGRSAQRIINGTDGINSDGTRVMLGLATMVGLGMTTFALHNYASTWRARQNGTLDPKDELPDLDNWRQWMLQGTSRSGVLGVFGQINDVMDNVGISAPNKVIRSFDPDPDLTDPIKKYGRPNAVKNLTGPTAGLIDDVISTTRGIAYGTLMEDQQLRRSHVRALARNTPFINAFYLKALTREALEHLSDDVLALPPDRK